MTTPALQGIPQFDQLEIVRSGVATFANIPAGAGATGVTVNHNLGFTPIVIASAGTTISNNPLPYINLSGSSSLAVALIIYVSVLNTLNVTFTWQQDSTGSAVTAPKVNYYLCRIRAS